MNFVSSLPRSCLTFLALAVCASLANCAHGIALISVGAGCLEDSNTSATQEELMLSLIHI